MTHGMQQLGTRDHFTWQHLMSNLVCVATCGVLGLQEGSGLIWLCREGSGISLSSSVCKFDEWGKWKYFEFWFIFFG